jgi:hypothetical protein
MAAGNRMGYGKIPAESLTGCGKTHFVCHSEERSDEESLFLLAFFKERFLASLGMTEPGAFFRSLLTLRGYLRDIEFENLQSERFAPLPRCGPSRCASLQRPENSFAPVSRQLGGRSRCSRQ